MPKSGLATTTAPSAASSAVGGSGILPSSQASNTLRATGAALDASKSQEVAFNAGLVSGETCKAIGVNWNFDPCVDVLYNWRNTIVNTRAYGDNPDDVLR